jgi:hypothetical protein
MDPESDLEDDPAKLLNVWLGELDNLKKVWNPFRIDVYLWNENSELLKSVYSIDNQNTRSRQFYIQTEKGARGQDSRETERGRGRES